VELVGTSYSYLFMCSDTFVDSQVFPSYVTRERGVTKQSALAKLKEKRAQKKVLSSRVV
jgi:hypothetical protein